VLVWPGRQITGGRDMERRRVGFTLAAAILFASQAPAADKAPAYHLVKEIPIAGDTGWDYLSIDEQARRLYVTHGTHIVVVDIDSDTVVGDITDTPGVHGFAIAQGLGKGFASNGAESKVSVVDLKTLKTLEKVDIIAAASGKVVATVPLPGKPEFSAADSEAGRVFVNIEDKNEVVAIDTRTHQITNTWPIAPGESASGMAIDTAHHRLFLGCENHLMLMLDSTTGKVVASVPIDTGVDANAFDAGTQLAFSSNGAGNVTIAHEDSPSKLSVLQTLKTQASARTMALDPTTHRIYLSAATFQPETSPPPQGRHRRATVPGSFKVLVYAP
jgi:hypothetical protein